MHLTEVHQIKEGHSLFRYFNSLAKKSKDIWNTSNYIVRQEFIKTSKLKEEGKLDYANWIRWTQLDKILRDEYPDVYRKLPSKSVQLLLKQLDETWKSYFQLIKEYKRNPSKFKGRPQLPKYKDKVEGRNLIILNNQQFKIKDGYLYFLSRETKNLKFKKIKSKINDEYKLVQLRIAPLKESYNLEIVYKIPDSILKEDEGLDYKTGELFNLDLDKFMSIDLGLDNFATVVDNIGNDNYILNGGPIKSINRWANKFQTFNLSQKKKNRVWKKRDNKLKHIFHHMVNHLINDALNKGIKTIVVGYNKEWKQKIKIGKRNNQNFVNIPYYKFLQIFEYKCQMANINLVKTEESYTSKCSFLDGEEIKKQVTYSGKRIKRGLFKTKLGRLINADVNGALNIGKKVFPNGFNPDGIEGFVVSPHKITFCG